MKLVAASVVSPVILNIYLDSDIVLANLQPELYLIGCVDGYPAALRRYLGHSEVSSEEIMWP